MLWRYRILIGLTTILAGVAAVILALTATPIYRAQVVLTEVRDDGMSGGLGNDTMTGGAGIDLSNGAGGTDIAAFTGTFASYTVTSDGDDTLTVVGADGTDTLTGIETLRFSGGDLTVAQAPPGIPPRVLPKPSRIRTPGSRASPSTSADRGTVRTPLPEVPPSGPAVQTLEVTAIGFVAMTTRAPLPFVIPRCVRRTSSRTTVS